MKVLAIIPARYSSTRFKGKPIRAVWNKESGRPKTMIELVYRQVHKEF